jgi:hypothetical protein
MASTSDPPPALAAESVEPQTPVEHGVVQVGVVAVFKFIELGISDL